MSLGLTTIHLCGTLLEGSIAAVGVGVGGLDAGVSGEVGDDVLALPDVSTVVVVLGFSLYLLFAQVFHTHPSCTSFHHYLHIDTCKFFARIATSYSIFYATI